MNKSRIPRELIFLLVFTIFLYRCCSPLCFDRIQQLVCLDISMGCSLKYYLVLLTDRGHSLKIFLVNQ